MRDHDRRWEAVCDKRGIVKPDRFTVEIDGVFYRALGVRRKSTGDVEIIRTKLEKEALEASWRDLATRETLVSLVVRDEFAKVPGGTLIDRLFSVVSMRKVHARDRGYPWLQSHHILRLRPASLSEPRANVARGLRLVTDEIDLDLTTPKTTQETPWTTSSD